MYGGEVFASMHIVRMELLDLYPMQQHAGGTQKGK